MKKIFKISLILLVFLYATPICQSATIERKIINWAVKNEVKHEAQKVADKYIDVDTQKEMKQEWKEYKKYKKQQEKKFKKKQKRIEKKKKEEEKKQKKEAEKEALNFQEEENLEFSKYNDSPGVQELDFFGIYGKRQISCEGIISPDYSKMLYSEVHFYPSLYQLTSELYILNLGPEENTVERVTHAKLANKKKLKFYRAGMEKVEEEFFRTLTPVDWSYDSRKILIKERLAENLRGFLETRIWVYEEDTQKTYYIQNLRRKIESSFLKKGLNIASYKWDLYPMGWYENDEDKEENISPSQLIVHAYGYKPDKTKVFLGAWLVNYKTCAIQPIYNLQAFPPSQNALVLRPVKKKI